MYTLKDIARMAGVSPTAVSFYINNRAKTFNLSDATCQKIQKVIDECNYRPNFHARAIKNRCTCLIGVLVHNIASSFYAELLQGIETELRSHNYYMILAETLNDVEQEERELSFMTELGVDGCIIAPCRDYTVNNHVYAPEILQNKPCINILSGGNGLPVFDTDHTVGAGMVADAFLKAGHRKLAYFGESLPTDLRHAMAERYNSFKAHIEAAGGTVEAFFDLEELVRRYREFTGVFCFYDRMAVKLAQAMKKQGIRIPQDISICGYGNELVLTEFIDFKLTTVHECKGELGQLAAQSLLEKLANPNFKIEMLNRMKPKFIPGETILNIETAPR